MKKLPTLQKSRWINRRNFAVVALVALMLAVSYLGTMEAKTASVTLPMDRVPLEATGGNANNDPAAGSAAGAATPASTSAVSPTGTPTGAPVIATADGSFDEYRNSLTAARESSASLLDEVIGNASASAETVREALRQKAQLAWSSEVETVIETLLLAKGFEDVLCTVRDSTVNIVVRTAQLTQQQAAQILDIAVSEAGVSAANVRIIPAE